MSRLFYAGKDGAVVRKTVSPWVSPLSLVVREHFSYPIQTGSLLGNVGRSFSATVLVHPSCAVHGMLLAVQLGGLGHQPHGGGGVCMGDGETQRIGCIGAGQAG